MAGMWDAFAGSPTAEPAPSMWDKLFGSYANVGGAMPEANIRSDQMPPDALVRGLSGLFSLPQRAIEGAAQYRPGSGEIPDRTIGPALQSAMLTMGGGAAGVPMRAGETALGSGPVRGSSNAAEDAMAAIERAISGAGRQSQKPTAELPSGEDAMAAIERAVSGAPSDLQSRIVNAVKAGGGTGVKISDIASKLHDVPLEDIHAEMMNMQRNEKAVLSNWDDPRSTTPAMKNAAINVGGDPRHVISLLK